MMKQKLRANLGLCLDRVRLVEHWVEDEESNAPSEWNARISCLAPLAFFGGRVQWPTEQDWSNMKRLISSLIDTREVELVLQPKSIHLE